MTKHGTVKMWQLGTFLTDSPQEERKTFVTSGGCEKSARIQSEKDRPKGRQCEPIKKKRKNCQICQCQTWLLEQTCHSAVFRAAKEQWIHGELRSVGGKADTTDGERGSIQSASPCYD